jgi:hypothetical protein
MDAGAAANQNMITHVAEGALRLDDLAIDDLASVLLCGAVVAPDLALAIPVVPVAPDLALAIPVVPDACHLVVPLRAPQSIESAICQRLLDAGAIATSATTAWKSLLDLERVFQTDLTRLVDCGLARCQTDDFGDVLYALELSRVQLDVYQEFGFPVTLVDTIADTQFTYSTISKIAAIIVLRHRGWVEKPILGEYLDEGIEPHFSSSGLARCKWFWLAMVMADEILVKLFRAGLRRIELHMPGGYYRALVQLVDLKPFFEMGDMLGTTLHAEFLQLPGLKPQERAIADEGASDTDDEMVPRALEPEPVLALPAAAAAAVPHAARPPVEVDGPLGKLFRIRFDYWSHQSGNQRAYLACPYHKDDSCIMYRFVHHFEPHADPHRACAAWILAWASLGADVCGTKGDHLAAKPSDDLVAEYFLLV